MLYGTTFLGGTENEGSVFSVSPKGDEHVIYSFKNGHDCSWPRGGLVALGGKLYGTADNGGKGNHGCVFEVTVSGKERVVYRFNGYPKDGQYPMTGVIAVKGLLYGTAEGGAHNDGVVFELSRSGRERVLYSFKGSPSDGSAPNALIALNGTFYGTTVGGGNDESYCERGGCGTIFKVSTSGAERVLHFFTYADGNGPTATLTFFDGNFYGTTLAGGTGNNGTVFVVNTAGKERVLYRFRGWPADGSAPDAALTAVKDALYGTTQIGGAFNYGTTFRIRP
jgi:uncharacterized repeat protein (TIGR03803 family)